MPGNAVIPMEISLATLAEAANVTADGKLNILGAFDTIQACSFPAPTPAMTVVVRLLFEYEDSRRTYSVRTRLVDQDGRELGGFDMQLGPLDPVRPGEFAHLNIAAPVDRTMSFHHPGRYRIRVQIGDHAEASVAFQVTRVPATT
jgi:hypothetical protein